MDPPPTGNIDLAPKHLRVWGAGSGLCPTDPLPDTFTGAAPGYLDPGICAYLYRTRGYFAMEIFLPVEVLTLEAFRHYLERVAYHHGTIAQADSPAALKQSSSRTNCFYCQHRTPRK